MKKRQGIVLKAFKYTGISVLAVLALLLLLPYCFPKSIAEGLKKWTNNNIKGQVNFSTFGLSFYKHFPSLTLSLYDFSLKGSVPYPDDTLVAAHEIAFGINLKSVFFEKKILINEIYLDDANINVQVDSLGAANYNILNTKEQVATKESTDSSSTSLKISKIKLSNCHLRYQDRSIPMSLDARGFNYNGKGDLSNAVFDLDSKLSIAALSLSFNEEEYLRDKKINAALVTQINTNSLLLIFRRNDLNINNLKLNFKGALKFLSNGYALDFNAAAADVPLYSVVTALPPRYLKWLEQTKVKGRADLMFRLQGNYIAAQNELPDMAFDMNIREGFVAYNKHTPVDKLEFKLKTLLPSLNTDSLRIDIDTFAFQLKEDHFDAKLHTLGLDSPLVHAAIHTDMDLDQLQGAIGFAGIKIKGRFKLDLQMDGQYRSHSLANGQTLIDQIPLYQAQLSLQKGYLKLDQLPQAFDAINFKLQASCKDGLYQHSSMRLDELKAQWHNSFIQGHAWLDNLIDYPMDAEIQSNINLSELKEFVPMDSLSMEGQLNILLRAKGKYAPSKKLYPELKLDIALQKGSIQTKYYPHPISNIALVVSAEDATASAEGLRIQVQPMRFDFEGKPFELQMLLENMSDLRYNIKAQGLLDFGKIYSVFSQKDLSISGTAQMKLDLVGRQSDVLQQRFGRLHNKGSLVLDQIRVQHPGYLPLPFLLLHGVFSFKDQQFYFDQFKAQYGHSDIRLTGQLDNVLYYAFSPKERLKGSFELYAPYLLVDEFMPKPGMAADSTAPDTSGVFVVPSNLSIRIKAKADKLAYDGLHLDHFVGDLNIDSAQIRLEDLSFGMIGTQVMMRGWYKNEQTTRARFDFSLQASDFDVHRAYKEVQLFHDMAPAAASAKGIVGIDYQLRGKLNRDMQPIYPSLEGGGVLSVRNIQFKGFKLLNTASKESGKAGLKDPSVKDVQLKTTIKNNVIALEKVRIKMAGFRLRVEGESDFDHHLRFKMRLGLPPLGIIGIPMTVSGTSDQPKIKIGKEEQAALPRQDEELEPEEETDKDLPSKE